MSEITLSAFTLYPSCDIPTDTGTIRAYYDRPFLSDGLSVVGSSTFSDNFFNEFAWAKDPITGLLTAESSSIITTVNSSQPDANLTLTVYDADGTSYSSVYVYSGPVFNSLGPVVSLEDLQTYVDALTVTPPTPRDSAWVDVVNSLIQSALGSRDYAGVSTLGLVYTNGTPTLANHPTAVLADSRIVSDFYNITAYPYLASPSKTAAQNVTAIQAAQTAAAITGAGIYIPVGTFPLNSITISVPCLFAPGASILRCATAQFVTFSVAPTIGDFSKHFDNALSGQGTIILTGDVYPDWWVANATQGTTNMAGAINAADASICSGVVPDGPGYDGVTVAAQGRVMFTTGIYRVNSTLTYRGAPWLGEGINNTMIARYGSSGATVDAEGTNSARRILDISDIYFYGGSDAGHSTGSVYGLRLGYNIRSYEALRRVKFSHFPSFGMYFVSANDDLSFYDVQVIQCGNTAGFSGIKVDPAVTDANDVTWFKLSLENNGAAGSGFGGGIDNTGAGVCKQWSFFGGLLQSNLGTAEVHFFGGSNINFYGTYIESEGTASVLTAMRFDTVLGVGIHDVFLTTANPNTGSALKFTGGTKGVIDNIRAFNTWTTYIALEDTGTEIEVSSLGALVPGVSPVSAPTGTLLQWPAKNSNGIFIKKQATPSTPTSAATLTASNLFIGILTATPNPTGATHAYTLPTGTNMESAALFLDNDSFDWSIANLAAAALDTITITANTDHTIVGNPIIQSANATTGGIYGNSAMFRSRRISPDVWTTYRLA